MKKRKATTLLTRQRAQGASSRTQERKRHRFSVSLVPPICSCFRSNPIHYILSILFSLPHQQTITHATSHKVFSPPLPTRFSHPFPSFADPRLFALNRKRRVSGSLM
ncbi:hypothetical protein VNO77_25334 [Canavalia gladiata]|uniref:Uncharacterized protein n=1 Tax=Canavalia gladiata TaxID=3824 RepID=A0AAN9L7Y0_CANGL